MVEIIYNGQPRSIAVGLSISKLLVESGIADQFCAVEVNEDLVPKAKFAATILQPGDSIEVVTFVGGG